MEGVRHGFGISPYMQELMTYAGHLECYVKSGEILEKFTQVKVSPSQVYRVTDCMGESLEEEEKRAERILPPLSKGDVLYVEIDGSMICTRNKESWKEIKPARLFRGSDCLNPDSEPSYLTDSQYVGHFGNSVDFGEKLQKAIDSYGDLKDRLIFLTDGATWIRERIADHYPQSRSIPDFFHVMEHLYRFADHAFPDALSDRTQWCEWQKALLMASQVETGIDNIEATRAGEKDKKQLTVYYRNNKKRMGYAQYRNVGCGIIGSGAIESAHRTVIQKRMKLSGQRWSTDGVKNMLRLRIISMNRQWAKVMNLLRSPLMNAAA